LLLCRPGLTDHSQHRLYLVIEGQYHILHAAHSF
jgi:hypothetical protein